MVYFTHLLVKICKKKSGIEPDSGISLELSIAFSSYFIPLFSCASCMHIRMLYAWLLCS